MVDRFMPVESVEDVVWAMVIVVDRCVRFDILDGPLQDILGDTWLEGVMATSLLSLETVAMMGVIVLVGPPPPDLETAPSKVLDPLLPFKPAVT